MSAARRVVTFDLWHTLLVDEPLLAQRAQRAEFLQVALAAHGVRAGVEAVRVAFAASTDAMMTARRADDRDPGPRVQSVDFLHRLAPAVSATPAILDAIGDALAAALAHEAPAAYDGVVTALAELSPRTPLGLISNTGWSGGAALRPVLEGAGIAQHLTALAFSDEVGWSKPDARIFRHCLAGLGGPVLPEHVLHVGDSLHADIAGAKRLGARACWIAPVGDVTDAALRDCDPLWRPDLVFPSVAAATSLLAGWIQGEVFPG